VRTSGAHIQSGMAYAAFPRRLLFYESSQAEGADGAGLDAIFFGEDEVQSRKCPGGWWDYVIPDSADTDFVLWLAGLHVVRVWRLHSAARTSSDG
jgi:hypothetical protein